MSINKLNKKPGSILGKIGLGAAGAAGAGGLYAAGELNKNTDRLHDEFGHVGKVLNLHENITAISSSVPIGYLGRRTPILQDRDLKIMRKILNK